MVALAFFGPWGGATLSSLSGGFAAAFSLVFVSEVGDKTFFIAALLAARRGRLPVLFGAVAALTVMTSISVGLGRVFQSLPRVIETSAPIGEYCAVALLAYFGVKALRESLAMPKREVNDDGELVEAEQVTHFE